MKATLLIRDRIVLSEAEFVELVVWHLPVRSPGSTHDFKYRLALVRNSICILRYDNEAGKGDHRHVDGSEMPYAFSNVDALMDDFWGDVDSWRLRT